MQEFAEEYVANLQPRDERYDTRLGDDFYVSTFPNGVKTWIFLYEVNGYSRRQTLGIYPEMPLDKALEALYGARRTRAVEKELMDQGLDGNNMVRKTEDSPIDLTARAARAAARIPRPGKGFMLGAASGAAVAAVVAGGLLWVLLPAEAPGDTPAMVAATVPAQPVAEATPPVGTEAAAEPATAPTAPVAVAVVTNPSPPVSAAAPPDSATASAIKPDPAPEPEASRPLGESQRELMELQRDMAGTLAWSQLTSGIVRGEPVDDLGWIVDLTSEPRRVFFFIRVRGMSGSTVHYRWTYEGTVVKRDAVTVGEGWHSPAFSSVTLTPEREGAWRVEVMDSEGRALGIEQFETRLDRVAALTRN